MKEKIFQAILSTIGTIAIVFLFWLGSPAQEYLEKLPIPLLVRLLAVLLLILLLLSSYILFLKWKHRFIPIHGLFRDGHWNFFCPDCKSLLAYRTDTPKEEHHFHCHKCRSSRYPDNNMTKEQILEEK